MITRRAVVHADRWHFFRHFLRDARPAYPPEGIDRYVEAWSQPGAATGRPGAITARLQREGHVL
jgi:hypothetical protein